MKRNKRAVVGMFIVFVLFAIVLAFLFGLAIPALIEINSNFYQSGQDILQTINKSELPQSASDAITEAENATPTIISILSFFYKYSWFIILLVLVLIIYIRSRTLVESEAYK